MEENLCAISKMETVYLFIFISIREIFKAEYFRKNNFKNLNTKSSYLSSLIYLSGGLSLTLKDVAHLVKL